MPRDVERRPRSRSRERHRDRGDRKQRDRDRGEEPVEDSHRRDRHRHDRDRHPRTDNRQEDRNRRPGDQCRSRSQSPNIKLVASEDVPAEKNAGEPLTDEQTEMVRIMGFCNFDSTKDKHVIGNSVYVANISKQRKYRQYMNRRGGFNRPLDPVA